MNTRICKKCGRELPETDEYFSKSKECRYGIGYTCKECTSKSKKQYDKNNEVSIAERKKQYYKKNKQHFAELKKQHYKDNREQFIEYSKQYREEHTELVVEYRKQYYIDNKENISELKKQYYKDNKEHLKNYSKQYAETNKEQIKKYYKDNEHRISEYKKQYKLKNKEYFRIKNQEYKSKKRELSHTLTIQQWENCLEYFEHKCVYCGSETKLSQDHFVALSKNGGYDVDNIIPSCKICNSSKHNNDFFDWYPKQSFYSKEREQNILTYLNMVTEENDNQHDESES